jgi:hypothetical protein
MKEQASKAAPAAEVKETKKPEPADVESSMLSSSMSAIGRSATKNEE